MSPLSELSPVTPEILELIMGHLPPPDLARAPCVNSALYLAAKPCMFREVLLDKHFHVLGPGHALEDLVAAAPSSAVGG